MHYHLIGICGTAMASLAGMLQARGHKVTGSDQNVYPPMSTQLEALGIEIMSGYKAENADLPRDCTIVGNTIMRGNPELEEVAEPQTTSIARRPRRFATNSFADVALWSLPVRTARPRRPASRLGSARSAGSIRHFWSAVLCRILGQSFRVTDSDYFVIEGDEYDTAFFDKKPKFMSYLPEIAIVNNIEFDHADIYKDIDAIKWQFSRLMNLVPGNGRLICGIDSPVGRRGARPDERQTPHHGRNVRLERRRKMAGPRYRIYQRGHPIRGLQERRTQTINRQKPKTKNQRPKIAPGPLSRPT